MKNIIKRILVGVAVGTILMLIRSNVFAANINVTYSGVYAYEQDSNTNTNLTNSLTTITSGTAQWYRVKKEKYRLRYLATAGLVSETGTYDVIFSTFNEDRAVYAGYLQVGYDEFACESFYDMYVSYPSTTGGNQSDLSSGSQTWICHDVYILNNQAFNIFLSGVVGASSNHYTYITARINWIKKENVSNAITDAANTAHQDAQQAHQDAQNINSSINSSTTPSGSDTNNAYSNFEGATAQNGVITSLVTLPVSLFTNILGALNSSCTRFDMGTLLGTHIYFNCINPANYLGSQLWSVIDILMSGFFVWYISRKLIKVFENLSSLKEGDPVGD